MSSGKQQRARAPDERGARGRARNARFLAPALRARAYNGRRISRAFVAYIYACARMRFFFFLALADERTGKTGPRALGACYAHLLRAPPLCLSGFSRKSARGCVGVRGGRVLFAALWVIGSWPRGEGCRMERFGNAIAGDVEGMVDTWS